MKKIVAVLMLLCFSTTAFAQAAAAQKPAAPKSAAAKPPAAKPAVGASKLPGEADLQAALQRTFGYDSSLTWKVLDVSATEVPGIAHVVAQLNNKDVVHLFVSAEKQVAFVGDMMPFGPNPFVSARLKLQAADGPARGPQTPVITIVEFSDLECPVCKAAQPSIDRLVGDFPNVKFVFQNFPLPATLHPWAMKAALYAECATQMSGTKHETFWTFVNGVFADQEKITTANVDEKLKGIAAASGFDGSAMATCAAAPATEARVRKSMALGNSLEVGGTPTVFINGRKLASIPSLTYEQLKTLVQFEIDHAGK